MKKKVFSFVILAGITLSTIYMFTFNRPANENYEEKIARLRAETNEIFKNDADSPLTDEQKKIFSSLSYFEVSEDFKVIAQIVLSTEKRIIKMAITDGSQREYYVYGRVIFQVKRKEMRLTVYKPVDLKKEYFFIPFYDLTTGESTYGGGRYVEPVLLDNGHMEIDFNQAYNPYCAYNHKYRCPIPPTENNLDFAITAGEKIPNFVK